MKNLSWNQCWKLQSVQHGYTYLSQKHFQNHHSNLSVDTYPKLNPVIKKSDVGASVVRLYWDHYIFKPIFYRRHCWNYGIGIIGFT